LLLGHFLLKIASDIETYVTLAFCHFLLLCHFVPFSEQSDKG
jgi:hypothetical protein